MFCRFACTRIHVSATNDAISEVMSNVGTEPMLSYPWMLMYLMYSQTVYHNHGLLTVHADIAGRNLNSGTFHNGFLKIPGTWGDLDIVDGQLGGHFGKETLEPKELKWFTSVRIS